MLVLFQSQIESCCDRASSPWYDYCDPKRYLVAVILGDIQ
jgi:hypothetical protein